MHIQSAINADQWDAFLKAQRFSPFLQSWTMGEVYREIGQEPLRLEIRDGENMKGICMALVVPARRGKHLAIQYGPVTDDTSIIEPLMNALKEKAAEHHCSFIRMSPFWPLTSLQSPVSSLQSPLHLLAEHIWYLPLTKEDHWSLPSPARGGGARGGGGRTEEELLMSMRKTTRNLIRRSEKEGVEVIASQDPMADLEHFIALHDETRKRHDFTPYSNRLFRAQVKHFAARNECTVYLARHQGEVLASSIHMHFGGETSYHHGASKMSKIPASYGLQWKAIQDALKRGDGIYNFWGIAPVTEERDESQAPSYKLQAPNHPFAGVTLFKTGFGGQLLNLTHCMDIPLSKSYYLTRGFEFVRKWRRGF